MTEHSRTDTGTYELTHPGVSRLPRPLKIRAQVPLTRQQVDAFDRLVSLGLRGVSWSASPVSEGLYVERCNSDQGGTR